MCFISLKGSGEILGSKGCLAQTLLLRGVGPSTQSSSSSGTRLAAYVLGAHGLTVEMLGGSSDAWLDIRPSTHILGFLLTEDGVRVGVVCELRSRLVPGKRGDLFQTTDGDISNSLLLPLLEQFVVDFSAAENNPLHLFGVRVDRGVLLPQHLW